MNPFGYVPKMRVPGCCGCFSQGVCGGCCNHDLCVSQFEDQSFIMAMLLGELTFTLHVFEPFLSRKEWIINKHF